MSADSNQLAAAQLAQQLAQTSPAWGAHVRGNLDDADDASSIDGDFAIHEGLRMHFGRSTVLTNGAPQSLRLLAGDWCFAAGLCEVAAQGDLNEVERLAAVVADAARAANPNNSPPTKDATS